MEKKTSYQIIQSVLLNESQSIKSCADRLNELEIKKLEGILKNLINSNGSLILSGVGKSGIIAKKISSTFCSLGMKSTFLHPVEALHGDLGSINQNDVFILISKSGTTEELLKLIPYLPMSINQRIGILGNINSPLALQADCILDCSVESEACINNLAPTTSTTVAMSMGDAIAVLYENLVSLTKEGFAVNHPAGFLGKSLTMKVNSIMLDNTQSPVARRSNTLQDIVLLMTKLPTGICCIVGDDNSLEGIIVEGDIRRALNSNKDSLKNKIENIMNTTPTTINSDLLAFDALKLMQGGDKSLSVLPVLSNQKLVGVLRLQDLLKTGLTL